MRILHFLFLKVICVSFFSETLIMLFIFYLLRPFYPFWKLRNKTKYRKTQKKDNNSNNCIIFKFGIILLLSIFLLLGKGHDQGNLHYVCTNGQWIYIHCKVNCKHTCILTDRGMGGKEVSTL